MISIRAGLTEAIILAVLIGVAGCAAGDDWVIREVKEQCATERPGAKDKVFDDCVAKRSDA